MAKDQLLQQELHSRGQDPSFDTFYVTVSANFQLNKYIEAIRLLDQMLAFKNLSADERRKAIIKKAEIFIKAHRFKDAINLIEKELAYAQMDKDQIIFLKAEGFYGLGEFGEAYDVYKSIADQFPSSGLILDALYGAAHSQNAKGSSQEAMHLFAEYFQKGTDQAKRTEALYNAILIGKKLGLTEEAAGYCKMYLSSFPDNERNGRVLFWLGALYAEEKQYEKSVKILEDFINKYPDNPERQEAYFLLAYNLQLINNPQEALAYYDKVDKEKQDSNVLYSALKNTAFIYFEKNDDEKAAEVIDKILMKFSSQDLDIKLILWLVQKYLEEKKFKDVLRILEKLELSEYALKDREVLEYFKAQSYEEMFDYASAISHYNNVLELEGDNAYDGLAHIGKGLCLMRIKDIPGARTEFNSAILENTEDNTVTMRARFELANIEKINGNLEAAAKFYMLVAVLYSDPYYAPESLLQAGRIFESLGRHQEARKIFQEIITDFPQSQAYNEIKGIK